MSEVKVPDGWVATKLGKYIALKNGFAFKSSDYIQSKPNSQPIIRISNLVNNIVSLDKAVHVIISPNFNDFVLEKGDLLIAMSGATTGKIGVYHNSIPAYQNQRVGNLKLINKPLSSEEFRNFLIQYLSPSILEIAYGGAQPNISKSKIEDIDFIIPPFAEQKEIARLLEQHLAQVEQIKAHLAAIPKLLTTFRQSVLADGVSGKLTESWRKSNCFDKTDIKDIGTYWQTSYKVQNKKYKPFKANINSCTTNVLPSSWQNTTIGCVCDVFVGSTPSRKMDDYWGGDINWVSSSEVAFCRIGSTKERITKLGLENSSTNIHPKGTVLLAMIGQGKTRGQAAILDIEACHNQNTAALRIPANFMLSEYLYYFLVKKYEDTRLVGSGNNQKALNKTRVQSLELTLPPLEEQNEIVRRVEELFAFADNIERQVQSATEHVNLLTQSILAKAFCGELTADWRKQNPELISGENSAEALLAKIQAQMKVDKAKKKTKS